MKKFGSPHFALRLVNAFIRRVRVRVSDSVYAVWCKNRGDPKMFRGQGHIIISRPMKSWTLAMLVARAHSASLEGISGAI